MRRKKRVLILVSVLILCFAIEMRICFVNKDAAQIAVEHYGMDEWVDLNGAFLDKAGENTQGYSIKIKGANVISYNDYIAQYGLDKTATVEGLDEKSIVNLQVEIENRGNDSGGINIFQCKLIPARKNDYFIYARNLWAESEPQIENALGLRLAKDTEYSTYIPYKINKNDAENHTEYKKLIKDTSFELIISNAPVRKVIDITL